MCCGLILTFFQMNIVTCQSKASCYTSELGWLLQLILGCAVNCFLLPFSGEHCNTSELGRLLQLILGCAVNCADKQEYIQRIMSMEVSVQQVVMNAIQEVLISEFFGDFYCFNFQILDLSENLLD